jgi:hypothetical protein
MRLIKLFVFSTLLHNVHPHRQSFVITKKICKDCKYFIGDKMECRKFGNVDVITGKITYDSARMSRNDEKNCGESATHFEDNQIKLITNSYYYIKGNSHIIVLCGLLTLYVYAVLNTIFK